MSIDRNQLSDSVQEARKAGADAARTGREPPAREDIEQFRNVMQVRQEARDEFAAARGKGAGDLAGQQREEAQRDVDRQHDAPELLGALAGRGEGAGRLAQRVHQGPHLEREGTEHEREEEPPLQPSNDSHPGSLRSGAALSRRGPGGGWPHWR